MDDQNTGAPAANTDMNAAAAAPSESLLTGTAPAAAAAPAAGVPESYAAFTVPEGLQITPEDHTAFSEVARTAGLSQEQAQKMIDYYSGTVQKTTASEAQRRIDQRNASYQEALKVHGKEGAEEANRALSKYGTQDYIQYLKDNNLDVDPKTIAVWRNVYKSESQGQLVSSNQSQNSGIVNGVDLKKLYPNSPGMTGG